jgi:hypothetical protein
MEPYPHHYTRRPKPTESTDPTIRSMVDELQQMVQHLGKKIEGRCDNTVEQHAEEHFISLEMARVEADAECADLDKHFSGLKLKVGRLNRFMERETMAFPQGTLGILNINDSTSARLSPSMPPHDPDGHRVESSYRDRELGSAQSRIPVNNTNQPKTHPHAADSGVDVNLSG